MRAGGGDGPGARLHECQLAAQQMAPLGTAQWMDADSGAGDGEGGLRGSGSAGTEGADTGLGWGW